MTLYLKSKSYNNVQAKVRQHFKFNKYSLTHPIPPPKKSVIQQWVKKFPATATIPSIEGKATTRKSTRKFTARSSENIGAVRVSVGLILKEFIRRKSQELRFLISPCKRYSMYIASLLNYIYMYIYIYIYIYIHTYIYIHIYIYMGLIENRLCPIPMCHHFPHEHERHIHPFSDTAGVHFQDTASVFHDNQKQQFPVDVPVPIHCTT